MINDSRRALNLSYNVLNLLGEVKTTSGVLKARYSYLADGTKLRVRDNGDVNGFDYLGSLTYRKSSAGLQLESASFGDGVIRLGDSNSGGYEVNYFLTDHLGSVRVVVDGNGVVKERNDYYPFGAKHVRSDYPQLAVNRFKYNGKEMQVTGGLDYLDYGTRMYDCGLGRWFCVDPEAEDRWMSTPYNYCQNNSLNRIDVDGTLDSPIYDPWGNFLGTDDQGLEGDAIIMAGSLFEQGMSHQDALSYDLGTEKLLGMESMIRFISHFSLLPLRPDYDGYLTKSEADAWWRTKTGEPLFVDQNKIELPGITTLSFKNIDGYSIYQNFIWGLSNTGKVYGTLKLTLLDGDNGYVHIGGKKYLDEYDFNMDGRVFRDAATWIGRPGGRNDGKSFFIYGYGCKKVRVIK